MSNNPLADLQAAYDRSTQAITDHKIPDPADIAALDAHGASCREHGLTPIFVSPLPPDVIIRGSMVTFAQTEEEPATTVDLTFRGVTPDTLESYYARQVEWSETTFGPGERTAGITAHIRKELAEIEAKPHDLTEWVDVMILAMDGFWRHGGRPGDLLPALLAKQRKNFARRWPDWRSVGPEQPIEHDRSCEA